MVIAQTKSFGSETVKLIGIFGIFVSISGILSGLLFGYFGHFVKKNKKKIFFLGFILNLITFGLVFINHSSNSAFEATNNFGFIEPKYRSFRTNAKLFIIFENVKITKTCFV